MKQTDWKRIGRPGNVGSRKKDICRNYDLLYGEGNWRFQWDINGTGVDLHGAFIIKGQNKTIAEMTPAEHNQWAASDRWKQLLTFLEEHNKQGPDTIKTAPVF